MQKQCRRATAPARKSRQGTTLESFARSCRHLSRPAAHHTQPILVLSANRKTSSSWEQLLPRHQLTSQAQFVSELVHVPLIPDTGRSLFFRDFRSLLHSIARGDFVAIFVGPPGCQAGTFKVAEFQKSPWPHSCCGVFVSWLSKFCASVSQKFRSYSPRQKTEEDAAPQAQRTGRPCS